jgi:hypothetical protein
MNPSGAFRCLYTKGAEFQGRWPREGDRGRSREPYPPGANHRPTRCDGLPPARAAGGGDATAARARLGLPPEGTGDWVDPERTPSVWGIGYILHR